ncbi:MAG: hypothetical protein ACK587_01675, partial [Cyanobacteriota bacterium]
MGTFPERFNPSSWQGPRAQQFVDRRDAFQQLMGDWLRELYGWRVSVSPTEGRDGCIDIWIEANDGQTCLADLPGPQVIECKDHDDQRTRYGENIQQGWKRVADKLSRQAANGWKGQFEPWLRACSYVYCISAVFTDQHQRENLQRDIQSFFDSLPQPQHPPLAAIHVLDWRDLRALLDRCPRVADQWLGTGLPLLPSHAEFKQSLTGFRRYLQSDHLPYVSPEDPDQPKPSTIWARLEAVAGRHGVLIIGVGGVGKTRLAHEVACLAEAKGWRVVHVLPGEPGVSVEDIATVVLSGSAATLLMFDYLDQMPNLDLGSLRRRLLPEAQRRGIPVALLANARPSVLHRSDPERDDVFQEEVRLEPTRQQQLSITNSIINHVAAEASKQVGHQRVREICGERPIIALLIAEQLEHRAKQGQLRGEDVAGFRHGDLLSWLRRRLAEDQLVVRGAVGFLPPEVEPPLITAAAMLAAAPLDEDTMVAVGQAACQTAGGDGARLARPILESLRTLGWLEATDEGFATAHDVVADEVLIQVLWDRASARLRENVLACCLAPAGCRARVLGRYALALARVLGQSSASHQSDDLLAESAGGWLRERAQGLAEMLCQADIGEASYALGGVLNSTVWARVCIECWSQLVAPWLIHAGRHAGARHVLFCGLREVPANVSSDLILEAITWSRHFLSSPIATYCLGPLLARGDLDDHAGEVIGLATTWLEDFKESPEARFIFGRLLARQDLGEQAIPAIDQAIDWLKAQKAAPEAQFVFNPLLSRQDLGEQAVPAIVLAIDWLKSQKAAPEARFVFNPLLARQDLGEQAVPAIVLAIDWLKAQKAAPEAQFVFNPLLARQDLGEQAVPAIV